VTLVPWFSFGLLYENNTRIEPSKGALGLDNHIGFLGISGPKCVFFHFWGLNFSIFSKRGVRVYLPRKVEKRPPPRDPPGPFFPRDSRGLAPFGGSKNDPPKGTPRGSKSDPFLGIVISGPKS